MLCAVCQVTPIKFDTYYYENQVFISELNKNDHWRHLLLTKQMEEKHKRAKIILMENLASLEPKLISTCSNCQFVLDENNCCSSCKCKCCLHCGFILYTSYRLYDVIFLKECHVQHTVDRLN